MKKGLLLGLSMVAAGATGTAFAQEGVNPDSVLQTNERVPVTTVVNASDSTSKKLAKTMTFGDTTRFMDSNTNEGEGVGIEPDPEGTDTEEFEPTDGGSDTVKEQDSPTKFTISTGLGYSIGGKTYMSNRIAGSGQLFKGTKGELNGYAHIDYDDPMHSTGSGKVSLGKSIYKGISLDGDYTFTGTGGNVVRLGLGYGGKIGEGQYAIKVFPYNSNGSSFSVKASIGTKVGKNGELSSFVFVDFGNNSYYGETEYAHRIAEGVALFARLSYGGIADGMIMDTDMQNGKVGLRFSVQ